MSRKECLENLKVIADHNSKKLRFKEKKANACTKLAKTAKKKSAIEVEQTSFSNTANNRNFLRRNQKKENIENNQPTGLKKFTSRVLDKKKKPEEPVILQDPAELANEILATEPAAITTEQEIEVPPTIAAHHAPTA